MTGSSPERSLALVLRAALWSGAWPEQKWRRAMLQAPAAHRLVVKASFGQMPAAVLIEALGARRFVAIWPEVRKLFDPEDVLDRQRLLLFDSTWGILTTGDAQYPVSEKVATLSPGRLALLRAIVSAPGISLADLAQVVGRSSSRVRREVAWLIANGLVDQEEGADSNRQTFRLYARESINTALARAGNARDKRF
ncbi:MAG: winged helix-turn-helix transcriptional regulator [Thermodesulfobacteriota bacterium]